MQALPLPPLKPRFLTELALPLLLLLSERRAESVLQAHT